MERCSQVLATKRWVTNLHLVFYLSSYPFFSFHDVMLGLQLILMLQDLYSQLKIWHGGLKTESIDTTTSIVWHQHYGINNAFATEDSAWRLQDGEH